MIETTVGSWYSIVEKMLEMLDRRGGSDSNTLRGKKNREGAMTRSVRG